MNKFSLLPCLIGPPLSAVAVCSGRCSRWWVRPLKQQRSVCKGFPVTSAHRSVPFHSANEWERSSFVASPASRIQWDGDQSEPAENIKYIHTHSHTQKKNSIKEVLIKIKLYKW